MKILNIINNKKFRIMAIIVMILLFMPKIEFAKENNNERIELEKITLGDVNNDNIINTSDLILVLRHIYATTNNKHKEWILAENKFIAADVTQNGKINSSDTITISRYIAAKNSPEIAKKHKEWTQIKKIDYEDNRVIEAESVTLNKSKIKLEIGKKEKLEATILPKDATDKTILWNSSNEKVATVDKNGNITAIGKGTAIITAKTSNGKESKCTVEVNEIEVKSVTLNKSKIKLEVGKKERLEATILPKDATYKTILWNSSNEKVATVDKNGNITAIGKGTAIITAKTSNGKESKCTVEVSEIKVSEIEVTSIKLDKNSVEMKKGETLQLQTTILPTNASNKKVTWTSSNSKIVSIDNGKIKANGEGKAIITVTTQNGKKDTCNVTVKSLEKNIISLSLDKNNITMEVGKAYKLNATVVPSDKKLIWKTSNSKVATVDKTGTVRSVSEGNAKITVTTEERDISATCDVIVEEVKPTKITLNKKSLIINENETFKLSATITPTSAKDKSVTWSSTDKNIVTVNSKGEITGKKKGSAQIKAQTSNGKYAICVITVVKPVTSIKLNKTSTTIEKGKTETLKATVTPDDATYKSVTWSSSNNTIATVTSKGEVKGIKVGTATITAKSQNGKTATCKVMIENPQTGTGKVNIKNGNIIDTSKVVFIGHKYTNLTDTQKKQIAYLAYLEQGSLDGAKIELSLMANLTEKNRSDYNIYKYVMTSGWFGPANTGMIPNNPQYDGYFTSKYVDLVNSVLVRGNRYLTKNVDEHDCISDISSISTGNKNNRSDYIPNKTIIYNVYGSRYKFVGFAPNGGDPFGYTY